ncbi:hypothetical protein MIND_00666400 [Mycena indigotica]|uniref:Secreted protein n=1 Tax=Mycena indigotica TaxID=2126181 RepID=A0A8H6SKF0_9AGAR|nr:uncharacterized protein MIND_00666400 [Mycena indigotica]KAF7301026.1 hypothetical protein MIND_00666400 [Mycena indigotica]
MLSRLALFATVAAVSLIPGVTAVSCGVCAPSIFYQGLTRTLTLQWQTSGNTVQCNYDTPAIPNKSPACVYRNVDGVLTITNTGPTIGSLPGACPTSVPLVQKTSC